MDKPGARKAVMRVPGGKQITEAERCKTKAEARVNAAKDSSAQRQAPFFREPVFSFGK